MVSAPGRQGPPWEGAQPDRAEACGPSRGAARSCRPTKLQTSRGAPTSSLAVLTCPSLWFPYSLGYARECAQVPDPWLHRPRPREQQPQHAQEVLRGARRGEGRGGRAGPRACAPAWDGCQVRAGLLVGGFLRDQRAAGGRATCPSERPPALGESQVQPVSPADVWGASAC